MPVAEVQEPFAGELCAVVGDDDVGDPKPVDDVGEEKDVLLRADVCDGSSLDPFGEFVDGHQQMGLSSCRFLERPHEVETPHREWPRDRDHLEGMSREMHLLGIKLAPMA
jgi:hypothetical protein